MKLMLDQSEPFTDQSYDMANFMTFPKQNSSCIMYDVIAELLLTIFLSKAYSGVFKLNSELTIELGF